MKPSMHHLPPIAIVEANVALERGADKHGGHLNWLEGGVSALEYLSKMHRHLLAVMSGEDEDIETQTHHLGNLIADAGIYLECFYLGNLKDDRPERRANSEYAIRIFSKGDVVSLKKISC